MQRVYEFFRGHPTGVDGFWALCLLAMTVGWTFELYHGTGERLAVVPVALGLATVLTLRRRHPRGMLLLAIGVGLLQLLVDVRLNPLTFAMMVIIYTNATRNVRWASRLSLAMAAVAPSIAQLRWPPETHGTAEMVFGTVFLTVTVLMSWVLGDSLRTRRAYYAQLEERAARLEREREARARVAVAAERARIARELHDVVAHNVSVMVVQADGAAYVLDTAPEQSRSALETIAVTGRQALAEMRRLLGVLRTEVGEPAQSGEYVPQPGVEQLSELVEQVRSSGLAVDFRIEGTPRPLPSSVELTAYRIVQEALTNTRKHGGPGASARVRLSYTREELALLVEDDGGSARGELYEQGGADGQGHGLIGMRERIGMVGGRLDVGPRPGGGFRISAVLPMALKTSC